jgi:hypothetical protein
METQFHLGLRRSDEPHEPVVHLAWHRVLRDDALMALIGSEGGHTLPSAVVTLPLDPLVDETLQVLAGRVARRYAHRRSSLFYGFGEPSSTFEMRTGQSTDPEAAFTCTTFVLALLRSVGVELIDVARWRVPTEDDLRWQREIGEKLLAWIEAQVHGDLVRTRAQIERSRGARRYRPVDVAGAALLAVETWPAGAEQVDPRARALDAMLPWPITNCEEPGAP